MSQILLAVALFLMGAFSQAAQFSTSVQMTRAREIKHFFNVTCSADEDFCERLCQNQSACAIEQLSCVDCVSQAYRLFKIIFTELNETFASQPDQRITKTDFVEFLHHDRWMVLSHDSYYNTFAPENIDRNKTSFNSMCPGWGLGMVFKSDALVLVKLDSANRPETISHIICQSTSGATIYTVYFHPDLSGNANDKETARPVPVQAPILDIGVDP